MAGFKRKDYGTWDVFRKSYSRKELESRRAQIAKAVNTRLRRLENATSTYTGKSLIDAPQFNIIMYDLESRGKRRFSEAVRQREMTDFEIRKEVSMLESFLQMKSASVGGYREIEEKRVSTFIEKGVPEEIASSPEFFSFLNSQTFEELTKESLDSEDIIDLIERASDANFSIDEILSKFQQHVKDSSGGAKALYQKFGLSVI